MQRCWPDLEKVRTEITRYQYTSMSQTNIEIQMKCKQTNN